MAQDPKKQKPQQPVIKGVSQFTFNTDGSQELSVPSVTKLLQRRNFQPTDSIATPLPKAPAPPPAAPQAQAQAATPPKEPTLPPTPGRRRNANKISALAQWSTNAPAPSIARAMMDNKEVASLLFLTSNGGATSSSAYIASAGYQLGARRQALCVGIQLSSTIAPDLWERVFKSQFIELNTQPSTESVHFLRQVLGADDQEWVLIAKCSNGPEQGILIIYSKVSLSNELNALLAGAPPPIPGPGTAEAPKKKRTGKTNLFRRAA